MPSIAAKVFYFTLIIDIQLAIHEMRGIGSGMRGTGSGMCSTKDLHAAQFCRCDG